jgi:hypothetical protein
VKTAIRSITSTEQFIDEANTVNQAMAFIPVEKLPYFVLNTCGKQQTDITNYVTDTMALDFRDPEAHKIRMALRRPDAFSFWHYCQHFVSYDHFHRLKDMAVTAKANRELLRLNRQDSVKNDFVRVSFHC